MSHGILFDFDGVIVDSEPLHFASLAHTLDEFGISLDEPTYYAEYLGFDDRGCFRYAFTTHARPADDAAIRDAIERKNALFERMVRREMRFIPGALEFVHAAHDAGFRLAIVSGALRREITLILEAHRLHDRFVAVVSADDVAASKPDPEGYRRGLDALGLPPERVVVIEDSLPGLAAARGAGLRCQMLTTSHDAALLREADQVWPDFRGRTPHDLPFADARR